MIRFIEKKQCKTGLAQTRVFNEDVGEKLKYAEK
jgi:hypothetical protein